MLTHGILALEGWKNLIDKIKFIDATPTPEPREVWRERMHIPIYEEDWD